MTETPLTVSIGARIADLAWERPSAACITFANTTLSRSDLHLRSNRVARALAKRGVGFGDFVTIMLPNGLDFMIVTIAVLKLGAIPQPVSAKLPKKELEAIVALAQSCVVVCGDPSPSRSDQTSPATLLAEAGDDADLPDRIAPSLKAPTSGGSTGRPKLIVSGRPGVVEPGDALFYQLGANDVALMPGPLYHNAPFSMSLAAIMAGSHLILMSKFDAEDMLRHVDHHQATWLYVVPTMMRRVWQLRPEVRATYDVSSLRNVWHMAAPCPPWLKLAWIEWLGGEKIWELYGGTESQAITLIRGDEWLAHRGSVGRSFLGEMAIFDEEGRQLRPGEVGTVYLRRPIDQPPTYRYIGAEPERRGDWETLGDIGWIDEQNYLYLTDRRADMILVGGANIYPAEIEAALDEHPLVTSSAVIGLPDDDLGNRVHAIIQTTAALDLEDLNRHLAERLEIHKRPRSVEFVSYALRDDAGKVRRFQLRANRLVAPRPLPGF